MSQLLNYLEGKYFTMNVYFNIKQKVWLKRAICAQTADFKPGAREVYLRFRCCLNRLFSRFPVNCVCLSV